MTSGSVGLLISLLTLATAMIGFLRSWRKIAEVHVLVNSQLHEVLMRVEQLTGTLQDAGIDVPETLPPGSSDPPPGLDLGAPL